MLAVENNDRGTCIKEHIARLAVDNDSYDGQPVVEMYGA